MEDARTGQAMERIEAALARIERASREAAQPRPQDSSPDSDLAERHEALKKSVSVSLSQLDELIGKLEE